MRKYVIYIGTAFLPDKNAAAQRAMMICKSYRDNGKIPIIIGFNKEFNGDLDICKSLKDYENIQYYSMRYPRTTKEWIKQLYSIDQFTKVINRYGIDQIHSIVVMDYMFIALWRLNRFCESNNIKLVVDAVDWFNKSNYKFPKNIIKDLDTSIRMKYIYKKMKYMIVISSYLKNYYEGHVDNLVLIPGTVDLESEKWNKVKSYVGNNILTLGYAGDPGEKFEKERLDWLIKIVSKLNHNEIRCKLLLAGVEESIIKNNIPEIFLLPNLKESVVFLGKIPHNKCLNMISKCDFSVIIRQNNLLNTAGFPTKLSESFACSTPVISTPTGDIGRYIVNGINGFITSECSMESLEELINKIINLDKKEIAKMHVNTYKQNELLYQNFNKEISKFI